MKHAQDVTGWSTNVEIEDSEAEIKKYLRRRGAQDCASQYVESQQLLNVFFVWEGEPYTLQYKPLEPRLSNRSDSAERMEAQAVRQMGRIAFNHVKVLMAMALEGNHKEMLLPYKPLTNGGPTLQQLGVARMEEVLQAAMNGTLALPAPGVNK